MKGITSVVAVTVVGKRMAFPNNVFNERNASREGSDGDCDP